MKATTRNAGAVLATLKTVGKQIIASKPCSIQIPLNYENAKLAQIGEDIYVLGVFAIILESGEYAVSNVMTLIKLKPTKVSTITILEDEYYEFYFDAGSVVIDNTEVVQRDNILFSVFNEFVFKANIPWFMTYSDLGKLYDTCKEYANSNIGDTYEVMEFIASILGRATNDRSIYYRLGGNYKIPPQYVSMASVFYSMHNTVNKIAGNYFSDGLVSALVNPSDRVEKIEKLLRA